MSSQKDFILFLLSSNQALGMSFLDIQFATKFAKWEIQKILQQEIMSGNIIAKTANPVGSSPQSKYYSQSNQIYRNYDLRNEDATIYDILIILQKNPNGLRLENLRGLLNNPPSLTQLEQTLLELIQAGIVDYVEGDKVQYHSLLSLPLPRLVKRKQSLIPRRKWLTTLIVSSVFSCLGYLVYFLFLNDFFTWNF